MLRRCQFNSERSHVNNETPAFHLFSFLDRLPPQPCARWLSCRSVSRRPGCSALLSIPQM
ncbi:hypothetical protein ANN_01921, partial [Periplaneta americana]